MALLWLYEGGRASTAWAQVPPVSVPLGLAWLVPWLSVEAAVVAKALVLGGALLGLFGWWTGPAFALVAVAGAYLLAIPQFHGGVQHTHHLVWFAALLAVSPCADAWVPGRAGASGHSRGWGVPTRIAWLSIAAIYFFPGVHKLAAQGVDWADETLLHTLYWKWAQAWDFVPLTRLDQTPGLLWLGGIGVLAFECGAPVLLLHRWTRGAFVLFALVFHASTALWFDIHFWHLAPCLVVLWPFSAGGEEVDRAWWPAGVVGAGLLLGIVWTGVRGQTQAWPFACYPTFDASVGLWMPTLELRARDGSGRTWRVPERALVDADRSKGFYSEAWGLSGLYGVTEPRALERFWWQVQGRREVQEALTGATEVSWHRSWTYVVPDQREVRTGPELWRAPFRSARPASGSSRPRP